jgi:hypothetical protein
VRQRFADLEKQWAALQQELEKLINHDIAGFNEQFRSLAVPAVVVDK